MIEVRARARQVWRAVTTYTAKAPGTHIYLLILFITTLTLRSVDSTLADQLLRQLSTNLYQMGRSAGRVLVISAFLLDGGTWFTQLVTFSVVYVPLERWAGTWRWLAVIVAGHVGATLVTTIGIWTDLRHDPGGGALSRTIDVGVSYGFVAAAALLSFAFRPGRWRALWVVGLVGYLGQALVRHHTFTDVGHASAACIGFASYLVLGPGLARRPRLNPPWPRWVVDRSRPRGPATR